MDVPVLRKEAVKAPVFGRRLRDLPVVTCIAWGAIVTYGKTLFWKISYFCIP
jgi:hypothetical protein